MLHFLCSLNIYICIDLWCDWSKSCKILNVDFSATYAPELTITFWIFCCASFKVAQRWSPNCASNINKNLGELINLYSPWNHQRALHCRQIIWVCLTILWDQVLNGYHKIFLWYGNSFLVQSANILVKISVRFFKVVGLS